MNDVLIWSFTREQYQHILDVFTQAGRLTVNSGGSLGPLTTRVMKKLKCITRGEYMMNGLTKDDCMMLRALITDRIIATGSRQNSELLLELDRLLNKLNSVISTKRLFENEDWSNT